MLFVFPQKNKNKKDIISGTQYNSPIDFHTS